MTAPSFPAGRYGRRRERAATPRWVVPLLVAALLLGIGWLSLAAYHRQNGAVQASVRSFVIGPSSVVVTFDITRPRHRAVTCLLRARDRHGSEVGRAEVPVRAGDSDVVETYTLPTRGRAVTGEVYGCSLDKSER